MKNNDNVNIEETKKQINIWVVKFQELLKKFEQMSVEANNKGLHSESMRKYRNCILKESFKNISELYKLVKSEKGQDVLGDILIIWRGWDANSWFKYLVLGYKVLLLTKDMNVVTQVIYIVTSDTLAEETLKAIAKIANAEKISFKGKQKFEEGLTRNNHYESEIIK